MGWNFLAHSDKIHDRSTHNTTLSHGEARIAKNRPSNVHRAAWLFFCLLLLLGIFDGKLQSTTAKFRACSVVLPPSYPQNRGIHSLGDLRGTSSSTSELSRTPPREPRTSSAVQGPPLPRRSTTNGQRSKATKVAVSKEVPTPPTHLRPLQPSELGVVRRDLAGGFGGRGRVALAVIAAVAVDTLDVGGVV